MRRFLWATIIAASIIVNAGSARGDEALAKKSGCLDCHAIDKKVIGPAFRDIAVKYKNDPGARAALIDKVKNGGKGNWTEMTKGVPMPPHRRLSDAEIKRLVDWVLGLTQ
jgi:cytochrome c